MPYELKKVKGGWKVQIKGGRISSTGRRYFSDSPLPRERAVAQMRALYASEGRKSPTRKRKPASPKRSTKSPTRKRKPDSPKRSTKSPTRKRKPASPKRKHKRPVSPKYKRK